MPDVGAGSLDGFEGNVVPPPQADSLSSSSSDTELLPEQVVSDAISRIQIDSDTGKEELPPSSHHTSHDEDSEREEVCNNTTHFYTYHLILFGTIMIF